MKYIFAEVICMFNLKIFDLKEPIGKKLFIALQFVWFAALIVYIEELKTWPEQIPMDQALLGLIGALLLFISSLGLQVKRVCSVVEQGSIWGIVYIASLLIMAVSGLSTIKYDPILGYKIIVGYNIIIAIILSWAPTKSSVHLS